MDNMPSIVKHYLLSYYRIMMNANKTDFYISVSFIFFIMSLLLHYPGYSNNIRFMWFPLP